jgi:hypothetical protein
MRERDTGGGNGLPTVPVPEARLANPRGRIEVVERLIHRDEQDSRTYGGSPLDVVAEIA